LIRILRDEGEGRRLILRIHGHLVAQCSEVLERACLESSGAGGRIVLDLSGLGFLGRPGVEMLGRLERAGVITIVGCAPLIADTLQEEGIEIEGQAGS